MVQLRRPPSLGGEIGRKKRRVLRFQTLRTTSGPTG